MGSADERIASVERELERLKPTLNDRIEKLERDVKRKPSLSERVLEIVGQAAVPLISGVVILVLGYAFKDSVDQAVSRQQLQLAYVKEMQALIEKMNDKGASEAQVESAALVLSTFGDPAVVPLINQLQQADSFRAIAAQRGLRSMAITESKSACRAIEKILVNQSRLYRWETHLHAIELLGDLNCKEALITLEKYDTMLQKIKSTKDIESYKAHLEPDYDLDLEHIVISRKTLKRTKDLLKTTSTF